MNRKVKIKELMEKYLTLNFSRVVDADLSTYNIFLEVLAKAGKYKKAERVFSEMKANCNPSAATYTSMINIYGRVSLSI